MPEYTIGGIPVFDAEELRCRCADEEYAHYLKTRDDRDYDAYLDALCSHCSWDDIDWE